MNEDQTVSLGDVMAAFKRNALMISLLLMVALTTAILAEKLVPRKYKAVSVLGIKTSYFQMPLVNDFMGGAREGAEMQAEKEALIRSALDDVFIDSLADRFALYSPLATTPRAHARARENLRLRIEYTSLNSTSLQIGTLAGDAEKAAGMNEFVLNHIVDKFIEARRRELIQYRDSLKRQLDSMGIATQSTENPAGASQPELVKEELASTESRISVLEGQFTPNHPSVINLKKKAAALRKMLNNPAARAAATESEESGRPIAAIDPKDPKAELYSDIVKKLNNLEIVLQLEKDRKSVGYLEVIEPPTPPLDPIFPKMPNFILAGLLIGALLSGCLVAFREVRRSRVLDPDGLANGYGMPLLGILPPMITQGAGLLESDVDARLRSSLSVFKRS